MTPDNPTTQALPRARRSAPQAAIQPAGSLSGPTLADESLKPSVRDLSIQDAKLSITLGGKVAMANFQNIDLAVTLADVPMPAGWDHEMAFARLGELAGEAWLAALMQGFLAHQTAQQQSAQQFGPPGGKR